MGVLSKLIYSLIPKTMGGLALWVVPLAAAIIIVVYPETVMKLLVKDNSQQLLDELTLSTDRPETVKKRLKSKSSTTHAKNPKSPPPLHSEDKPSVLPTTDSATKPQAPVAEDESDDLLKLAAIQARNHTEKSPSPVSVAAKKAPICLSIPKPAQPVESPALATITITNSEEKNIEPGWTRVPTREEETISSLRNKLTSAEADVITNKTLYEKEQKKALESEKELRDRTRSYQIRWVEMETEITSLKQQKADLLQKLEPSAHLKTQLDETFKKLTEKSARVDELVEKTKDLDQIQQAWTIQIERAEKLASDLQIQTTDKNTNEQLAKKFEALHVQAQEQLQLATSQVETSENKAKELTLELQLKSSKLADLQCNVEQFVAKEAEHAQIRSELQSKIAKAESLVAEATQKIDALDTERVVKSNRIDELEQTIQKLEKQSEELESIKEHITGENAKLKEAIKEQEILLGSLKTAREQLACVEQEKTSWRQQVDSLERQINEQEGKFEEQTSLLNIEIASLKESSGQDQKKHIELNEVIGSLQNELSNRKEASPPVCTSEQQTSLMEEKARLEQQVVALGEKSEAAQNKIEELSLAQEQFLQERTKITTTMSELETSQRDLRIQLERAEKKSSIMASVSESKYASYKIEIEGLQRERANLEARLRDLTEKNEKSLAIADQLVSEC